MQAMQRESGRGNISPDRKDRARVAVLQACADALLPALPERAAEETAAGRHTHAASFNTSGAQGNMGKVLEVARASLTREKRMDFFMLLDLLSSWLGTLLLAGRHCLSWRFPFVLCWAQMPRERREAALLSWTTSRIGQLRKAFKGFKTLIFSVLLSELDADGGNVYLAAIDYDSGNSKYRKALTPAAAAAEDIVAGGLLDLAPLADASAAEICVALASMGLRVEQVPAGKRSAVRLKCDVVVVGSGAGGGVAAALLAQAGLRVIVVEKASWRRAAGMSLEEGESMAAMYDTGGLLATEDGAIGVIAGATLGGGTRVNWCASFRTPDHVRREWATQHGLPAFTSEAYTSALDAVCARLGVHSGVTHNGPNGALKRGLEALEGVHCGSIPRNCKDDVCSGFCSFGCASGDKQDAAVTWLTDAVAAGARILTGVQADTISTAKQVPMSGADFQQHMRPLQASGVQCSIVDSAGKALSAAEWHSRVQVQICSRYVVSSCGTVHTPALLLRSNIKAQGNVGVNLRLHPATFVAATFPQSGPRIDYWRGAMMTTFSREVADWGNDAYGSFVSIPQAHPAIHAALLSWESGSSCHEELHRIPWMMSALIYQRDSGSGRVSIDALGRPRLHYWMSAADRESSLRGTELAIRALVAAGAESLGPVNSGPAIVYRPAKGSPEALEEYIGRVRANGIVANKSQVLSAHQMGTARMGCSCRNSVVDGDGESWDVAGLYVADSSAFPTSTGVNPMITVEALAYMVASGLAAKAGRIKPVVVADSLAD